MGRAPSHEQRGLGAVATCRGRRRRGIFWSSSPRQSEAPWEGILHMHWDPEPTPNPSQEGNFRGANECLLPSWEWSGVGRFMESVHGLMTAHWDHEPRQG